MKIGSSHFACVCVSIAPNVLPPGRTRPPRKPGTIRPTCVQSRLLGRGGLHRLMTSQASFYGPAGPDSKGLPTSFNQLTGSFRFVDHDV